MATPPHNLLPPSSHPSKVTLLPHQGKPNTQHKSKSPKVNTSALDILSSTDFSKDKVPKVWKSFWNSAFPFKQSLLTDTDMVNKWQVEFDSSLLSVWSWRTHTQEEGMENPKVQTRNKTNMHFVLNQLVPNQDIYRKLSSSLKSVWHQTPTLLSCSTHMFTGCTNCLAFHEVMEGFIYCRQGR